MSGMIGGPLAPLERYRDATDVPPPPELIDRIGARLLFEPRSTAPRRFLAALRARDPRGIARGLSQNVATAFRPGTRSMLLRAQATAILLVAAASIGLGSVAGLAATQHVVRELDGWSPPVSRAPDSPIEAPATVVAPPRQPSSVGGAPARGDTPPDAEQPGLAQAPGQACGRMPDAGSRPDLDPAAERCPEAPALGRDEDRERGSGGRRASEDRADRATARESAKGGADQAAGKGSDKGRADRAAAGRSEDRPTPKADDPGDSRSAEAKSRASDPGKAGAAASKKKAKAKRDRD